jgi:plastocyanin
MANNTINILGINTDGTLNIVPPNEITVKPGDTVTWIINPNSGVASITGITDNSTINVFSIGPAQMPNSLNWQGTISSDITQPTFEYYTIAFTTSSGENKRFDPKISVNP